MLRSTTRALATAVCVTCAGLAINTALASAPDLGAAGAYAVFAKSGVAVTVSSGNTDVFGDFALGHGTTMNFSGGGTIHGVLYRPFADTTVVISGGSSVTGGQVDFDTALAEADAQAASQSAASLAATQIVASLGNRAIINSAGALTVVNVTGNLQLDGGGKLTLNGGLNDVFVINIFGAMSTSGGSSIVLSGGAVATHVLFNVIGPGANVNFSGNSHIVGTVLALHRSIIVSGGTVEGALITCGNELKLQSGPDVFYQGFSPPGTNCCPGDLNCDGEVGASDLAILLSSWGPVQPGDPSDFDQNGVVDAFDLAEVLRFWNNCV